MPETPRERRRILAAIESHWRTSHATTDEELEAALAAIRSAERSAEVRRDNHELANEIRERVWSKKAARRLGVSIE